MFVLNQNIKGGGNITTFNAFNKRTQTNWIGAAIGAASSLVGGLMGQHSQSEANKNNLQIARYTLPFVYLGLLLLQHCQLPQEPFWL